MCEKATINNSCKSAIFSSESTIITFKSTIISYNSYYPGPQIQTLAQNGAFSTFWSFHIMSRVHTPKSELRELAAFNLNSPPVF